jgi:hypothetical protein
MISSMPQSLSKVIVHIIFSTKNRERWLDSGVPGAMPQATDDTAPLALWLRTPMIRGQIFEIHQSSVIKRALDRIRNGLQPREQKRREDARTRPAGCAHSQSPATAGQNEERRFLNFARKCFRSAMRPRIAFGGIQIGWEPNKR